MFTNGPILDMCRWYGEGKGMEILLQGMDDVDNIKKTTHITGKKGQHS